MTICAKTGSFRLANRSASRIRPSSRDEAATSTSMRPGFRTATQSSTAPLPRPLRTSLGFAVRGWSGIARSQIFPFRFRRELRVRRIASS